MERRVLARAAFVCVWMALPCSAFAQGALSGIVTDETDAVLPGVTVTALHVETNTPTVAITDGAGQYNLAALRVGEYAVTADLPGFTVVTQESLVIGVGQAISLDFRLAVATLDEAITVTATAPLIDTQQSDLGGRVDQRQIESLPVLGRNWMALAMLAPGSRATDVTDSPTGQTGYRADPGYYQLNMDGVQVTNTMAGSFFGNVRFARDAIAEFEFQSSRFDATNGRSMGILLNTVSKGGTNLVSGNAFGYFRHDAMIAADHVSGRKLEYANQQGGFSIGGPIVENDIHYFGYYEGEREPSTYFFNTPWPSFNIPDIHAARVEQKFGVRLDDQMGDIGRAMYRISGWKNRQPVELHNSTSHPSVSNNSGFSNYQGQLGLTQTFGGNMVHELKVYFHYLTSFRLANGDVGPRVRLRGLTLGHPSYLPLNLIGRTWTVRDDVTILLGDHELKVGADYIWNNDFYEWNNRRFGELDARGGPLPGNVEQLFPVWNDTSTWLLDPLSPMSIRWQQSFGDWTWNNFVPYVGAWVQDNWDVHPRLTLNVGLRWDYAHNWAADQWYVPGPNPPASVIREPTPNDFANFGPRLGFAWQAHDTTVVRGGWGRYYTGPKDQWSHHTPVNIQLAIPAAENPGGNVGAGRSDFVANPYFDLWGRTPTLEEAFSAPKDTSGYIAYEDIHVPYSNQMSVGLQQQIGNTMSFQADYVVTDAFGEQQNWNHNLTYNPATGLNHPYSDLQFRRYPHWGLVTRAFSAGASTYRALETAFTKRFSNSWQASVTYTLADFSDCDADPTFGAIPNLAPDLGGECGPGQGEQNHRLVANGIWEMPGGIQFSGLYFYGSGQRWPTTYGADLRNSGNKSLRLRPDGAIVPRNDFVGDPIHRVDLKLARPIPVGRFEVEASLEVFNLFNHANFFQYVTAEASPSYAQPRQSFLVAYVPRTAALGLRVSF
ncbi:MAG: TonB-dependent receptor [Acidobacteria bacterium]|nr:TonB-dependent receptor [Acidobacteriota bacterium]